MGRPISRKCQNCANLSVEDAKELHGPEGDGCWDPAICHRRRSHYRRRQELNAERRLQRRDARKNASEEMGLRPQTKDFAREFELPSAPAMLSAVLVLYRQHENSPVHAVGAEVWQGNCKILEIQPVHCMGMRADHVGAYIREMLQRVHSQFGIGRFEDVVKEIPVSQCPIVPCPYHFGG